MEAAVWGDGYEEDGPVKRSVAGAVTPLVRAVEWLWSPGVPGFNLCMALWAAIWGGLMFAQPETFDSGRFVGMRWLPDGGWIAFFLFLAVLQALACIAAVWKGLRVAADLFSAWAWLSVGASFLRVEIALHSYTPGTFVYFLAGFAALAHGIYSAGIPQDGG